MDEYVVQLLVQRIGALNAALDNFDNETFRIVKAEESRILAIPDDDLRNAEMNRILDGRRTEKISLNVKLQEHMNILQDEANFRTKLASQRGMIQAHEQVYSQIVSLEGMLATPGLSAEMQNEIKAQIDTLLYERDLGIDAPSSEKNKEAKRQENIDKLSKKIEGLYVGLNSIYGNVNEEIFGEDIKNLAEYQEKLDKQRSLSLSEKKEKIGNYKLLEDGVKRLDKELKADKELLEKNKELEEKKKKLELQKKKIASMGDPQKEYDDIASKTPIDNKALMKAKDKLDNFKRISAENATLESEISTLEAELSSLLALKDIIQSLFTKLGIKDEKGNDYEFRLTDVSGALETVKNHRREQGLDSAYMKKQKAMANSTLEKYGITAPKTLPKKFDYVEVLNQQRKAIEDRRKSYRVQPGWEDKSVKGIDLKKEESKVEPKAASSTESKSESKVAPAVTTKGTPGVAPKAPSVGIPSGAPASAPGASSQSVPASGMTPSVASKAESKAASGRADMASDRIPETYVPIHTSAEEHDIDDKLLPQRASVIIDRAESSDRNMAALVSDPDSRKIEGGYLYRIIDDGKNITRVKEDIEYYTIRTDKKLEDEIKNMSDGIRNLSRQEKRNLLSGLDKEDDVYKMLASNNPIARYNARKNYISSMNEVPNANLEMLLALKSAVIPEKDINGLNERIRCLERSKGNIYNCGYSDLDEAVVCKTKKGIFGRTKNQYSINKSIYEEAEKVKEAKRGLDDILNEWRAPKDKDTRVIRRTPSRDKASKGKGKDEMDK